MSYTLSVKAVLKDKRGNRLVKKDILKVIDFIIKRAQNNRSTANRRCKPTLVALDEIIVETNGKIMWSDLNDALEEWLTGLLTTPISFTEFKVTTSKHIDGFTYTEEDGKNTILACNLIGEKLNFFDVLRTRNASLLIEATGYKCKPDTTKMHFTQKISFNLFSIWYVLLKDENW